jgi:catechol 2,3-dioxygenase-like lactoylglutathione lyase family enzyme
MSATPLPLNQIAFAVLDLRRTEAWWRDGLGFIPAGGTRLLFRRPWSDGRVQKLPGSAMTCWCLLGRNDWAQLEMFQYESPVSKLMPEDYRPCDHGFSRCGVWVADFDAALARLAALGTLPLSPPQGAPGMRRACVRNPDGVYVELMEDDPLPQQGGRGRIDCPVAIRSVTLSTPDFERSAQFLRDGLGMQASALCLHEDAHEALWDLGGARSRRQVFVDGSGTASMLLELVEYMDPPGQPLPADYRLCDQRILNACFGDPVGATAVMAMLARAEAAGARRTCAPLNLGPVGCVYVDDPLGFSWEFMWAKPGLAQRAFGWVPLPIAKRPVLDHRVCEGSIDLPASPKEVFAVVGKHDALGEWSGLGISRLTRTGAREPGGRGAERTLASPLGEIVEQIIDWWPGRGYRYRIIAGGPFVGHVGEVALAAHGNGTRLTWRIRFRSRVPALGWLLQTVLQHKLNRALLGLRRLWA